MYIDFMLSTFIGLKLLAKGDSYAFNGIFSASTPKALYSITSLTVLLPIYNSTVSIGYSG